MRELLVETFEDINEFNKYYKRVKENDSDVEIVQIIEGKYKQITIYFWYIF